MLLTEAGGKLAVEARRAGAPAGRPAGAPRGGCSAALAALQLYRRDQHYVVADGKVQIVDESTGRVMPDRAWEQGLHQMIEAKEGVPLTGRRETLARITYQRFFRRYLRLAGMTGTATEVAAEIGRIYGLRSSRGCRCTGRRGGTATGRALPARRRQRSGSAVADAVADDRGDARRGRC